MAKTAQKITLSPSRDIPFDKLMLSQSNVRRVKAGISTDELAESIARRGLIQSLNVRPVFDDDGHETGMFEVPAGGRRYRALEMLVKQKRLARTASVPCVVGDATGAILTDEVSLAENIDRAPLHPLDQFRAFQALREKGMTEEAIAAAFFLNVNVVKQRLRLASVSPVLLDIYAEDGMTLEMVMAFTVSENHARQEQVWEAIQDKWQKEPWHIRRMLTEKTVQASDRRARFVGIDAYEAAGGIVLRDLFETDDGGWLQDVGLLDRLVTEKLTTIADQIASEGWKWVEAALHIPYGANRGLRQIYGTPLDLSPEEEETRTALQAEYDRLQEEYDDVDELPEEIDQRLGEIETALEELDNRPVLYDPADIPIAGVFVTLAYDGSLSIDRGYVRSEDELPLEAEDDGDGAATGEQAFASDRRSTITIDGQPVEDDAVEDADEDNGIKPLSDGVMRDLTVYRTLALQDAIARHPQVAMTALLHKLALIAFRRRSTTGALDIGVRSVHLSTQDDELQDSAFARSVTERHEQWKAVIPVDDDEAWDWIAGLDDASRLALLAHCISSGINALYERPNPYSASGVSAHELQVRFAQADRLARTVGLDMVDADWRPTVGNYLGRVTKARILEAVREGLGEEAAHLIEHLKKEDMARQAESLLAAAGWLPEPLRLAEQDSGQETDEPTRLDVDEVVSSDCLADDGDADAALNEGGSDTVVQAAE